MFCGHCGKPTKDGDVFCGNCGKGIVKTVPIKTEPFATADSRDQDNQ